MQIVDEAYQLRRRRHAPQRADREASRTVNEVDVFGYAADGGMVRVDAGRGGAILEPTSP